MYSLLAPAATNQADSGALLNRYKSDTVGTENSRNYQIKTVSYFKFLLY